MATQPPATTAAAVPVEEPPAASSSTVNTIYVAYHAYEHYSSVRNLAGPKTGLPCTREIERPPGASASTGAGSRPGSAAATATGSRGGEWKAEDAEPVPTNEEMLVLSSLPPSAFTLADIRRAAAGLERADPRGEPPAWESVVELLLERFEASGPASSASSSKTAWREVDGLAGTESDASGRTTTAVAATASRGKKAVVSSVRGRGRGRGRGKSRSSLGVRVAGRRAGSSPSTASSSEGGSSGSILHDYPAEAAPAATRSTTSSLAIPSAAAGDHDDDGHERSSPSLSPPPDTPPASPLINGEAATSGTSRVRLKRPPPSSAGSYTQPPTLDRPGKERRRERKARVDQEKAARRSAGAVGVGLRTRSRASAGPAEKVGEVEGGMREIHI